jgi:3-phytase
MRSRFVRFLLLVVAIIAVSGGGYAYWYFRPWATAVAATVETAPVPNDEDAADDPAIYVNPLDGARSLVIGTDKGGGLSVYDLSGKEVQRFENGAQNNVDIRQLDRAGTTETIAAVSTNDYSKVFVYRIDAATSRLERLVSSTFAVGLQAEGLCMYRSAKSGKTYVIVNGDDAETDDDGWFEQYELAFDRDQDRYVAKLARRFDVGGEVEGCVADDETGALFVSEEHTGVWRYGAEPDAGDTRDVVERLGVDGRIRYNAEGLTLYRPSSGDGFLVVSSQGSDDFLLYDRLPPHRYRGCFRIVGEGNVDAVTHTDGIDVVVTELPGFERGLFVAQDDENGSENQNFKLVSWRAIEAAIEQR